MATIPKVTGMTVTLSGQKVICTFKRDSRGLVVKSQYRVGNGTWHDVANNRKSCSITFNPNNYAPNPGKPQLPFIEFRVRQSVIVSAGQYWSAWETKRYTFAAPYGLRSHANLDEDNPNKSSYSFEGTVSPANAFYKFTEYQSILAFESDITDGSQLNWDSSQPGWQTGTVVGTVEDTIRSGSITITEDSETLAQGSQTRWVRFRSRGIAADSAWTYTKHVYAQPFQPTELAVKSADQQQSLIQCTMNWETPASASHPVDYIQLQYAVAVPTASKTPPTGTSWTELIRLAPKDGTDGYSFVVPDTLDDDECLFLRVVSFHDTEQNYNASAAVVAAVGNLADPENLSVVTDDATHRATVTATNKSDVPDSFLAIKYMPSNNPQNAFYVGIIPHGQSSVQVQCPNWDSETAIAFSVQAFAGTYTAKARADGAYTYELNTWMHSTGILRDGGSVPVAPSNVTATPTSTSGTIRVAWDWSWEDANKAILSWSDHADAWESTDAPSTYEVEGIHAPAWNISGLETGKTWYIRVALADVSGESETRSPWSDIIAVDLASAPSVPTLVLDKNVIAEDDSFTASWGYASTDGTAQAYAVLCLATITPNGIVYGDEIAHTQTAQHITLTASELGWEPGNTYHLCVKVTSASGKVSDEWSDPVALTVADKLTATIDETSLVEETIVYGDGEAIPDTTPYLFRRTGGGENVGNMMVETALIGGSVVENQLVRNGNFEDTSVWTTYNSSLSMSDNIAEFTVTTKFGSIREPRIFPATPNNHIYFAVVSIKLTSGTDKIKLRLNGGYAEKYCQNTTAWQTLFVVYKHRYSDIGEFSIVDTRDSDWDAIHATNAMLIDLTQMFGTDIADYAYQLEQATAGSGIAWLKSQGFLTEDYIPFNEGEIKSVSGLVSHDMVGFNQFNIADAISDAYVSDTGELVTLTGNSTTGFIRVLPQAYYFSELTDSSSRSLTVKCFDNSKKNLLLKQNISYSATGNERVVTAPNGTAYIAVNVQNSFPDDFCINLSWSGYRNGEYEPYVKHSYPLDSTLTLMGKPLLVNGQIQYNGDKYHSNGEHNERYAIVDLGTLNWQYNATYNVFRAVLDYKPTGSSAVGNIVSEKYIATSIIDLLVIHTTKDKSCAVGAPGAFDTNFVVRDTAYTDPTAFKAAMSGVMLVYEKATPTTSQAEPFTALQLCDPSGTEEYVTSGIPVGHETEYAPEDGTLVRTLALTEMPLTAIVTGAGQGGTTMLAIERAQDYQMARPDGDTSDGFTGENVALFSQMGEDEITIDNGDLLGHLDDGAWYRLVATVQDGFGQSATAKLEFMVHWSHQAIVPEAEAEPIEAYSAMQITPIPPNGTAEGDTFDIYRLSADKPELIVKDGEWGTTYVDPYPAIREFGGHRVVFKTKNGDYITEDDTLAWIDLSRADDDYIDRDCSIIDFEGAELIVRLNMSVSDDYEKQFTETRYKGGSVVGDWNKGISRKGAIKAVALADDPDTIRILRELARFEGVCHVRTPNGTSYAADVQVGLEQSYESVERAVSFDLTITRVDVQDLDGMTLDEWNSMHSESE